LLAKEGSSPTGERIGFIFFVVQPSIFNQQVEYTRSQNICQAPAKEERFYHKLGAGWQLHQGDASVPTPLYTTPLTPTKSEKGLPKAQKRRKILSSDREKTERSSF
jgi:hypothetical protein